MCLLLLHKTLDHNIHGTRYTGTTVDTNFSNISKLPSTSIPFSTRPSNALVLPQDTPPSGSSQPEPAAQKPPKAPTQQPRPPRLVRDRPRPLGISRSNRLDDTEPEQSSSEMSFRPSRRVRTAPGGETHDLFSHTIDDDALASAPPVPGSDAAASNTTGADDTSLHSR